MDINVLKTFVAVCEYSGFSAAAEKLGYSQSTVSSQIKQLEIELDTVLFDRIRHRTILTVQGEAVLSTARQMLELHQKLYDTLHRPEEITGEIRLAMADSVCRKYFTEDYLAFHKMYPEITLKITSAGTEQMFDMLRKNEADLVFTMDEHIYDSEFEICGESLEQTHFVVSPHHPLVGRGSLQLADLIREKFYLTEPDMSYRKMLDAKLATASMEIHPIMELGNTHQICALLSAGEGISLLPDSVTRPYLAAGELVYLPVEDCEIKVWNQILIHKHKWRSQAIEAFIEYYKKIINR